MANVAGASVGTGDGVAVGVRVRVGVSIQVRVRVGVLVAVRVPSGGVLVRPPPAAGAGRRSPTSGTGGLPGPAPPTAVMQRTAIAAATTAAATPQRLTTQFCLSGAFRSSSISLTIASTSASVTTLPFSLVASVASPKTPEAE
jgi:hypothetical protein